MKDLHELPRFSEGLSYLYLDHCRIEQDAKSIAAWAQDGITRIPAAALGLLLLGPGTTVTHSAMRVLAENGVSVVWCGELGVRTYAASTGETRHSRNLLRQAWLATREPLRLAVVTRMYRMRFPDPLPPGLTLQQIRGKEGARVRDAYAAAAAQYGIEWTGRTFDHSDWNQSTPVNRALSAANSCLYGLCHAAILSLGYSPALGFIHTGKQLSFVYDIADLYKVELSVPAAFQAAAESPEAVERRVRLAMRQIMTRAKLLERIPRDIAHCLDVPNPETEPDPFADNPSNPASLWEPSGGAGACILPRDPAYAYTSASGAGESPGASNSGGGALPVPPMGALEP